MLVTDWVVTKIYKNVTNIQTLSPTSRNFHQHNVTNIDLSPTCPQPIRNVEQLYQIRSDKWNSLLVPMKKMEQFYEDQASTDGLPSTFIYLLIQTRANDVQIKIWSRFCTDPTKCFQIRTEELQTEIWYKPGPGFLQMLICILSVRI